eukprot:403373657
MSIGVPIKLLHEAENHVITVELKSGELYRGYLMEAEDTMNMRLDDVYVTGKDGRQYHLDQVFVRGSQVRFIIIPDMLKNSPMFKRIANQAKKGKNALLAKGRGRGIAEEDHPRQNLEASKDFEIVNFTKKLQKVSEQRQLQQKFQSSNSSSKTVSKEKGVKKHISLAQKLTLEFDKLKEDKIQDNKVVKVKQSQKQSDFVQDETKFAEKLRKAREAQKNQLSPNKFNEKSSSKQRLMTFNPRTSLMESYMTQQDIKNSEEQKYNELIKVIQTLDKYSMKDISTLIQKQAIQEEVKVIQQNKINLKPKEEKDDAQLSQYDSLYSQRQLQSQIQSFLPFQIDKEKLDLSSFIDFKLVQNLVDQSVLGLNLYAKQKIKKLDLLRVLVHPQLSINNTELRLMLIQSLLLLFDIEIAITLIAIFFYAFSCQKYLIVSFISESILMISYEYIELITKDQNGILQKLQLYIKAALKLIDEERTKYENLSEEFIVLKHTSFEVLGKPFREQFTERCRAKLPGSCESLLVSGILEPVNYNFKKLCASESNYEDVNSSIYKLKKLIEICQILIDLGNFNLVYEISSLLTQDTEILEIWKESVHENISLLDTLKTLETYSQANFEQLIRNGKNQVVIFRYLMAYVQQKSQHILEKSKQQEFKNHENSKHQQNALDQIVNMENLKQIWSLVHIYLRQFQNHVKV